MAKNKSDEGLPFFKFHPGKWSNGRIDDCSLQAQGLFINICIRYWARRGDVLLPDLKSKFKRKEKLFTELITKDVVKISGDKVVVNFLDDQLTELGVVSQTNRDNANARWNRAKTDATASDSHSDRNANADIIEKKRKEENRIEKSESTHSHTKGEIEKEIFGDEIFIEQLESAHRGKDIKLAFDQCYNHHASFPRPPTETWEWKQKLNTWLSNMKPNGKQATKDVIAERKLKAKSI